MDHKTALELIQQGWTQGALARDTLGQIVNINSDKAVCWCSRGAIDVVYGSEYARATKHSRSRAIKRLKEVIGRASIVFWNDKPGRTQEEVVEAFVKAGI